MATLAEVTVGNANVARVDSFHTCINRESGVTVEKSPYHKFALSFRLSDEQKAQGSDNDSYGFPVSLSSVKQM